jgi:hypothetical protein
MQRSGPGYRFHQIRLTIRADPGVRRTGEVRSMKRIRIEKPKPRVARDLEPQPLDPRDPDIVRVKRGTVWKYADRRWAV